MNKTAFDPAAVAKLYDDLAPIYADFYPDYPAAVAKQGKDLWGALSSLRPQIKSVYDCSCGIGTQIIGIAQAGGLEKVHGADISPASIEKARANADKFSVNAEFSAGDMRQADKIFPGVTFDAVISCGNSLGHILSDGDATAVFSSIRTVLNTGGIALFALTDHEREPRNETTLYDINVKRDGTGPKTVNFQVWTWLEPHKVYFCEDYTLSDTVGSPSAQLKKVSAPFRAWRRAELNDLARASGYARSSWIEATESGHHNPLFILEK
jgi:SAM-dependent methyltransferase